MLQTILFNVVITVGMLILAIAVHEWAHVAMARFLGDPTGERMGRFTLNPLAHADPIWTVLLPSYFVVMQTLAGGAFPVPFFGAGKPAPYTPVKLDRRFRGRRIPMAWGQLLVALAGPLSNLVMALVSVVVVALLLRAGHGLQSGLDTDFTPLVFRFALLNVGLFLFNLIPIPPLDGSQILFTLLPRPLALRYEAVMDKLSWLLLIVLFLGGARYVLAPLQGIFATGLVRLVRLLAG